MRDRRLLRLRRRARRRLAAALRRGARGGRREAGRVSLVVGRLELAHPVLNASGTWDAVHAQRLFGEANPGLAGFVTKTVTPEPRPGNPAPRIAPALGGLINSIGLPGPGIDAFCA
ncbi:MAG: hypothetical protein FJW81_10975, partial [Actinobacteria bacterium]|nr:hypothetical protein [Actinomycetota bacterium]